MVIITMPTNYSDIITMPDSVIITVCLTVTDF